GRRNGVSMRLGRGADGTGGQVGLGAWPKYGPGGRVRYVMDYSMAPRHIHGANLGMSAAAYRAAGGFPALNLGEDAALISSLLERKADIRFAGAPRVSTSARWESTIEGGFAAMLRGLREKRIAKAAVEPLAA